MSYFLLDIKSIWVAYTDTLRFFIDNISFYKLGPPCFFLIYKNIFRLFYIFFYISPQLTDELRFIFDNIFEI